MLVGGWGRRALELLEARSEPERHGELAVAGSAGAGENGWRCWLTGHLVGPADLNGVVSAHERIGPTAVEELRGNFAVVAFDEKRGCAFVSRDQLGGQPLVFARLDDGVLFAEHEDQLLDLLPTGPAPDRLALTGWLEAGGLPPGRTLFDGIERLPPGHRLVLSERGVAVEPYWQPSYVGTIDGDRAEVAEQLRDAAFAAVDRAAVGSDRAAVRLSGGLDSACVAAGLASRRPTDDSADFALGAVFPGHSETDEKDLIEATAAHAGLELRLVSFEDEGGMAESALRYLRRWRLPPASPNLFVWERVAQAARELGVGVSLDGEGGDELFGLAPYLIADRLRRGRFLGAWTLTGGIPGIGTNPGARLRLRALRVFGVGGLIPDGAKAWRRRRDLARKPEGLVDRDGLIALAELGAEPSDSRPQGPIWWGDRVEALTEGNEPLDVAGHLRRRSRLGQIEERHPFLFDLDLVETALRIPPARQFDPVRDRVLLREGLAGRIPEQVRSRYAKSFFTPLVKAALAGDGGRLLLDPVAERDAPIRAYVRATGLERLLESRGPDMPSRAAFQLWRVALADAWLRAL